MHTDTHDFGRQALTVPALWAANEPIEPIHEYTLPIPPHKQPPRREDFLQKKERRRPTEINSQPQPQPKPSEEGHVDDYA
jgi:hypothetical protein